MRIIEAIAAIAWIILGIPRLVFAWLGILSIRIRPRLIRLEADGLPPGSGHLAFNANDNSRFCRMIQATCMDLDPCFFDVVRGRVRLKDAFSFLNQVGNKRRLARGPQSNLQKVGLPALFLFASGVLWLAYRG